MEVSSLVPAAFGVVMTVIGWFVRVLWDANRSLALDLAQLREALPRQFVMREDYHWDVSEIKDLLRAISVKLDLKADK